MPEPRTRRLSVANDEFQLAASLLTNRRQRTRQRRFVVQGVRGISVAVEQGWPIESLWYPAGGRLSDWARGLLESKVAGIHYEGEPALLAQLSEKEDPAELVAIAEIPPDDLDRIPLRDDALILAFDRPTGPGNLGSVIRSAQALGAHGLVITGHAVDVYEPQTVRASVGALFALPVVRAGSMEEVQAWLARVRDDLPRLHVVGTSAKGDTAVAAVDFTRPAVVAIGNETRGLSVTWRELCDDLAVIPMAFETTSLNVAAAAAIVLYECRRQRDTGVPKPPGERA
jgi:23S rRNA (uridine2479-2'-O)-methyltransferase